MYCKKCAPKEGEGRAGSEEGMGQLHTQKNLDTGVSLYYSKHTICYCVFLLAIYVPVFKLYFGLNSRWLSQLSKLNKHKKGYN